MQDYILAERRKSLWFDVLLLCPFNIYLSWQATDSSFCRTALLEFAIRVGTPVNMKEGDNQRDQGKGLPPLSLFLRFSPSWLPLSLPIPLPRWGVGKTRKTTCTLYILSMQGRLTLHVRILVHISQVSGVF